MQEFIDRYIAMWKNAFVFEGRERRSGFWMPYLVNIVLGIIFGILIKIPVLGIIFTIAYGLYCLAVIIPSISLGVRRLHDTGKSGLFMLFALVPILNIVLIVWFATEGVRGPNEFGNDPKEIAC